MPRQGHTRFYYYRHPNDESLSITVSSYQQTKKSLIETINKAVSIVKMKKNHFHCNNLETALKDRDVPDYFQPKLISFFSLNKMRVVPNGFPLHLRNLYNEDPSQFPCVKETLVKQKTRVILEDEPDEITVPISLPQKDDEEEFIVHNVLTPEKEKMKQTIMNSMQVHMESKKAALEYIEKLNKDISECEERLKQLL